MNYKILSTRTFDKELKRLAKKYPSIKADIIELKKLLINNPTTGIYLKNHCYKIRLAIKSKKKGKSGGARIITNIKIVDQNIYLLTIYDKSEKESISIKEIMQIIENFHL